MTAGSATDSLPRPSEPTAAVSSRTRGSDGRRWAWRLLPILLAIGTWFLFLGDRAPGTDAARIGLPLDDGWIHLVYARAVVQEGGFHYNRGRSEAGMTSPLWVVVIAPVVALAGAANAAGIVLGVKLLSLAAGLAAIGLLESIALEMGVGLAGAVVAGSLVALDPATSFARASGMEIELFVALVLAAALSALRGRALIAGTLAGLSVVARPEGIVLLPLYAALLMMRPGQPRASPARLGWAAGLAVLPAALYVVFCLVVTGCPLPNTFYVKFATHGPFDFGAIAFAWANDVHDLPWFTGEAGTALLILGLLRGARSGPRGVIVLAAGILLFLAAATSRTFAAGHYFYWERWIDPCLPFLLLAIALGIEEIRTGMRSLVSHRPARGAQGPRRRDRARSEARESPHRPAPSGAHRGVAWTVAAAIAGIVLLIRVPSALKDAADQFAWNAQNIQEENVALGRWIAANTPPDAVVAVSDAGALRYFGDRTTIDMLGLNDHRVLRHDPALGSQPLEALRVGYLVLFPAMVPELVQALPLMAVQSARAPHYTIARAPQDVMVVYRLARRS